MFKNDTILTWFVTFIHLQFLSASKKKIQNKTVLRGTLHAWDWGTPCLGMGYSLPENEVPPPGTGVSSRRNIETRGTFLPQKGHGSRGWKYYRMEMGYPLVVDKPKTLPYVILRMRAGNKHRNVLNLIFLFFHVCHLCPTINWYSVEEIYFFPWEISWLIESYLTRHPCGSNRNFNIKQYQEVKIILLFFERLVLPPSITD